MTSVPSHDEHVTITRLVYEYAYGIDTRDWELYRSIFADRVTVDFSSYHGQPARTVSADDWVAGCEVLFAGLDASQHVMTNPLVDVDGDRARCRMYMKAEHILVNEQGDDFFTIGGCYDDQLERRHGRWEITAVTLNVWWNRGNRHIMDLARAKGEELLARG